MTRVVQEGPESLPLWAKDAVLGALLGPVLGEGSFRRVYAHATDRTLVVKVQLDGNDWPEPSGHLSFANAVEWNTWCALKWTTAKTWFAPCVSISACGRVLIQKRTTAVKKLPKELPSFFDDIKPGNFGKLDGRIVCHDYALNNFIKLGVQQATKRKKTT